MLARLDTRQAGPALAHEPAQAHNLLRALTEHVGGDDTHPVQFGEAATVVIWLHGICSYAADHHDWDLLEEAAHTMCTWDGAWNQWNAQDKIGPWLRTLKDQPHPAPWPPCATSPSNSCAKSGWTNVAAATDHYRSRPQRATAMPRLTA